MFPSFELLLFGLACGVDLPGDDDLGAEGKVDTAASIASIVLYDSEGDGRPLEDGAELLLHDTPNEGDVLYSAVIGYAPIGCVGQAVGSTVVQFRGVEIGSGTAIARCGDGTSATPGVVLVDALAVDAPKEEPVELRVTLAAPESVLEEIVASVSLMLVLQD